ncbi:MAG TPA: hypothetical protein VF135_07580, partial [Terriglobales bacterium]
MDDYKRAEQFLPGNLRQIVKNAEVRPHFIGETSRFWYRRTQDGKNVFVVVDPAKKNRVPLFDHAKLAAGLSRALGHEISATDLPFENFELAKDESSIKFDADGTTWLCVLANGECTKDPGS